MALVMASAVHLSAGINIRRNSSIRVRVIPQIRICMIKEKTTQTGFRIVLIILSLIRFQFRIHKLHHLEGQCNHSKKHRFCFHQVNIDSINRL